jgi:hypothetical protein
MSSKTWSDAQKWAMGIASSLIVALVIGVTTRFSVDGTASVSTAALNSYTRSATAVARHIGATDPENEGFVDGKSLALPHQQARWDEIEVAANAESQSWRILNPVLGAVRYRRTLNDAIVREALRKGWRITLRARLLSQVDTLGGIHANFSTGVRRYDLNVMRAFPQSGNQDTRLRIRLNTAVEDASRAIGREPGYIVNDGLKIHEFVMSYDHDTETAQIYVDGTRVMNERYSGHDNYVRGGPWFLFGASGCEADFELAAFEIFD